MKVAILGSTGMLGSMVKRFLSQQEGYELTCPTRSDIDASWPTAVKLYDILRGHDYALNCIGIIKSRINEKYPASIRDAIRVNSLFPHQLAQAAEWAKCTVLQIATDCVYSGRIGSYDELDPHDATDVYGKTKSLGEVLFPNVHHLRCSIIGPEPEGRPKDSLLEWFLGQPAGSALRGFTNHRWNGITTLAFAKICHGIMSQRIDLPQMQHIVPAGTVTKAELLQIFAVAYNRADVSVGNVEAPQAVDRTLSTLVETPAWAKLWEAAGYVDGPPYIHEMVREMAAYK